jgi:hypothetical protein
MKRDAKELVTSIATKCNIEPTKILQTIHVNKKGLNIIVDDDVVHEFPEGQDMVLEFSSITPLPAKREWDETVDVILDSEEVSKVQNVIQFEAYELKLIF